MFITLSETISPSFFSNDSLLLILGRHRPAGPRSGAGAAAGRAFGRAVRPQLCRRGGPRPAHGPGGRQSGRRLERGHGAGLPQRIAARLHLGRSGGRGSGRRGEERAGHRHRPVRRAGAIGCGRRTGPQCPRRLGHAGAGRDDAAGCGPGRAARHLHGPVGPGRPGAHSHRPPVAQPQGGPAAGRGPAAGAHPGRTGPCGRRRLQRPHRVPARGRAGRGHAHLASRGGGAGRATHAAAGGGAADGARREGRAGALTGRADQARGARVLSRPLRNRSAARPRIPPRPPHCSG